MLRSSSLRGKAVRRPVCHEQLHSRPGFRTIKHAQMLHQLHGEAEHSDHRHGRPVQGERPALQSQGHRGRQALRGPKAHTSSDLQRAVQQALLL